MTSQAELRRLTVELRAAYPNVVQVGRWLAVTPLTHVIVGLMLDGSSDKRIVRPTTIMTPLYDPTLFSSLAFGSRCRGRYEVADLEVPCRIREQFDTHIASLLPGLLQIEHLLAHVKRVCTDRRLDVFEAYSQAALGDFAMAREVMDQAIERYSRPRLMPRHAGEPEKFYPPSSQLVEFMAFRALLDGAPHLVAEHLRGIELASARARKLEQHWQPAPFPFEVSGAVT